jgi:hypothetical protein
MRKKKMIVEIIVWILVVFSGIWTPQLIYNIVHHVEPIYCVTPPYQLSSENGSLICRRWS